MEDTFKTWIVKLNRKIIPEFFRIKIIKSQIKSCMQKNHKIIGKIFSNTIQHDYGHKTSLVKIHT